MSNQELTALNHQELEGITGGMGKVAKGALIGSGTGAVTGAALGAIHSGKGALVGAVVGAASGAGLGAAAGHGLEFKDKQAREKKKN